MAEVSSRFRAVPASNEPLLKKAAELASKGRKAKLYVAGDPVEFGFFPSQHVRDALVRAVNENLAMYPHLSGKEPILRQAIAEREKSVHGVEYATDDILITPGTTQALTLIFSNLLNPGDEFLSPEPTYQGYFTQASYMGATIRPVPTLESEGWQVDLDALRKSIGKRTKAILINTPNNPTGAVYSRKTLKGIADIAGEENLLLLSDEIYDTITFDGGYAPSIAEESGEVPSIVVNGPSKCFMVPGWRCGYLAIKDPQGKIRELTKSLKLLRNLVGNVSTPVMTAVTVGYQNWSESMKHLEAMLSHIRKAKEILVKRLSEIGGVSVGSPRGTFYIFPRFTQAEEKWKSDLDFALDLADSTGLLFVPGSNYGPSGRGHLRMLLLPSLQDLSEACDSLLPFLSEQRVQRA